MSCQVNVVIDNSKYILAPSLQEGFLDIVTGLPLSDGVVTFYRDLDHTQLKPIFTISGPPDAPIFTQLPNPLTLSSIGTFEYMNEDIIPYYYPYDDAGNVDLYYITVYNSHGDLQFTRDHFPSVNDVQPSTVSQVENYVPDGQFLLHYNLPNNGLINASNVYGINYGGWIFYLLGSSNSTNYVTFPRYDSPINNPAANPRYACNIECTVANPAESRKDLSFVINDVNFLQGQLATYQVTAYTTDSGTYSVKLIIRQSPGTGGSSPVETLVGTLTVTPSIQNFTFNFTIPSTIGLTLGPGVDDKFEILLRMPLSLPFEMSFTDVIFIQGTFAIVAYPDTTSQMTKSDGLAGSFDVPQYDGSDQGKFVKLGTTSHESNGTVGLAFVYDSPIPTGTHIAYVGTQSPNTTIWLVEDGTAYATQVQPNNTIPAYVNLFNQILSCTAADSNGYFSCAYGTGVNGFSYKIQTSNTIYIQWNRFDVLQPPPNAGTSGFIFTLIQPAIVPTLPIYTNGQQQIYSMQVLAGSSITPGSYYTLITNSSGPQFIQLFWFSVDGVGTAPSVPYDVITKLSISATYTTSQVLTIINSYGNGLFQVPDLRGRLISYWDDGYPRVRTIIPRQHSQNEIYGLVNIIESAYISGNDGDTIGSVDNVTVGARNSNDLAISTVSFQTLNYIGLIKT